MVEEEKEARMVQKLCSLLLVLSLFITLSFARDPKQYPLRSPLLKIDIGGHPFALSLSFIES